jgi:hypothetical protein
MANWRQIQGRIRRAKTSPDAPTKLAELYAKTHDGMVAFELGAVEEKAAHADEAVRWYTTAIERFRRADWKKRAAEALERLGASVPADALAERPAEDASEVASTLGDAGNGDTHGFQPVVTSEESDQEEDATGEDSVATSSSGETQQADSAKGHRRRRRGRRGGRGRHKHRNGAPGISTPRATKTADESVEEPQAARAESSSQPQEHSAAPRATSAPEPMLPSERIAHGRHAEPAIASHMAKVESLLRRLLGSQLHRLDEIEDAPAGPGVFLISDSDLVNSYYVEACKTLRLGIGQLMRSQRERGRSQSSSGSFRSKLADHLEINESKVADYLKKHCVVRWIQLDDDAPYFAHFVIGVLKTPLNAE